MGSVDGERENVDDEFVANAKQKLKIEMRSSPSHLRDQAATAAVGSLTLTGSHHSFSSRVSKKIRARLVRPAQVLVSLARSSRKPNESGRALQYRQRPVALDGDIPRPAPLWIRASNELGTYPGCSCTDSYVDSTCPTN